MRSLGIKSKGAIFRCCRNYPILHMLHSLAYISKMATLNGWQLEAQERRLHKIPGRSTAPNLSEKPRRYSCSKFTFVNWNVAGKKQKALFSFYLLLFGLPLLFGSVRPLVPLFCSLLKVPHYIREPWLVKKQLYEWIWTLSCENSLYFSQNS